MNRTALALATLPLVAVVMVATAPQASAHNMSVRHGTADRAYVTGGHEYLKVCDREKDGNDVKAYTVDASGIDGDVRTDTDKAGCSNQIPFPGGKIGKIKLCEVIANDNDRENCTRWYFV